MPPCTEISILLLYIRAIISRGSLLIKSTSALPWIIIRGRPDLSRSCRLSIVASYRIFMREERSIDWYPRVRKLPITIHMRIANCLIFSPGLWIHFLSLPLGISSIEVKKSVVWCTYHFTWLFMEYSCDYLYIWSLWDFVCLSNGNKGFALQPRGGIQGIQSKVWTTKYICQRGRIWCHMRQSLWVSDCQ